TFVHERPGVRPDRKTRPAPRIHPRRDRRVGRQPLAEPSHALPWRRARAGDGTCGPGRFAGATPTIGGVSGVHARAARVFGTSVAAAVVLVALLSSCMADRIAIPDAATAPTRNAQPVSPATERAAITPDTATLAALARDDGQPLTRSVRLRDGTIFV